jgi:hypothetical protein
MFLDLLEIDGSSRRKSTQQEATTSSREMVQVTEWDEDQDESPG